MNKWSRINYHPNLSLGPDGRRVTASPEHIRLQTNILCLHEPAKTKGTKYADGLLHIFTSKFTSSPCTQG